MLLVFCNCRSAKDSKPVVAFGENGDTIPSPCCFVELKIRFHDFSTITRATTFGEPVDSAPALIRAAKLLLAGIDPRPGVRLVGLSVSGLVNDPVRQLRLDDTAAAAWPEIDHVVDAIRARFGDRSIGPAVLAGRDGIRLKRRGDQQWGPDAAGRST